MSRFGCPARGDCGCGPVLTNSTRLTTRDLVEIAQTRGQDHLLAFPGARIEADVTDVLLNRGNKRG